MAFLTVGPNSDFPTIAAAMVAAGTNDTVLLEAGYGNENAMVTQNGMTVSGDATSTGINLTLATGISTFTLAGTAPIDVRDASDGQGIVGNAGDNAVTVTDGADAVDGGLGNDQLVVDYSLATGAVTGDSTSNFTEAGGTRSVTITAGTFEHFEILTGSGADTITTGGGDDVIITGEGASTVTAGQGANTVIGGSGADTVTALDGGNVIDGGDGTNVLTSGGGADTIIGGLGADTIVAGAGDDLVLLSGGADTADSGAGRDRLSVDYGTTTSAVTGGVASGNLLGGYVGHIGDSAGNMVDFQGSEDFTITTGSGADVITTGDGMDVLNGGAGNDLLDGQGGDDVLAGGAGADGLLGGAGVDTADYSGAEGHVRLSLIAGLGSFGDAAGDTFSGVENVIGSVFGDTLKGDNNTNRLAGNGGDDRLDGQGGDDVLVGGAGADLLTGGQGVDTADFSGSAARVTVSLSSGVGVDGDAAGDTFSGVENLTGSAFNDRLKGDSGANRLDGGAGADTLDGQGGDDVLIGGGGADHHVGGQGVDTADFSGSAARVTVSLSSGTGADADAAGDTFSGVENVTGSAFDDRLKGDGGANRLDGGAGADTLDGQGGDDVLIGGGGADVLIGGAGVDTADYSGATGLVMLSLIAGSGSYGDAAGDTFSGIETVTGSAFGDTLKGDNAANRLEGRGGDDRLDGQGGHDIFVFGNGVGDDTIYGFVAGAGTPDAIDLSANSLLNGFADVLAQSSQSGLDTLIDLGGGDLLTLFGVTSTSLHQDDFVF